MGDSWGQPRGPSEELVRRATRERAGKQLAVAAQKVLGAGSRRRQRQRAREPEFAALLAALTNYRSHE